MVVQIGGRGLLLASTGWRPGVLLKPLQCAGQPPQQGTIWPQLSVVPKLRSSGQHERVDGEAMQGLCPRVWSWGERAGPVGEVGGRPGAWGAPGSDGVCGKEERCPV